MSATRKHPRSIAAYSPRDRVAAYDADMEIMHPLRRRMVEVVLEVLPFGRSEPLLAIDLGTGTGLLAAKFLEKFSRARVTAVDGSAAMVEEAKSRLGKLSERVRFVVSDFRALPPEVAAAGSADAVITCFALHHLTAEEKRTVIARALGYLKPGGWFLNADLVMAGDPGIEGRIQELRVEGVVSRAPKGDSRFRDNATTRRFLDKLERGEKDRPLTLAEDLRVASDAGLASVEVFWKEYREVVWGGVKAGP